MFKFLPVYQAHVDSSDTALPIDEESRGQSVDPAVKLRGLIVADQHAVIQFHTFDERLNHTPPLVIHGDSQNHQAAVLVLALKIDEPRDFNLAGTAPSGPEIEEHDLSAVIRKMNDLSIPIFQGEIRGVVAVLIYLYRGRILRELRSGVLKEIAKRADHHKYGHDSKYHSQFRHYFHSLLLII